MDADGCITAEYEMLVNPLRDLGPTPIHGVRAYELLEAPQFPEIAGDVVAHLDGSVVVAHNIRFERSFLDYELQRSGMTAPAYPSLCTLALASRYGLPARRLSDCCDLLGIERERAHCALSDARATASLLTRLLARARDAGVSSLVELQCTPLPAAAWPVVAPSGRSTPRSKESRPRTTESYVAMLIRQLPPDHVTPTSEAVTAYLDVLERALEDRVVTGSEAEQLAELAREWGIDGSEVDEIHADYLGGLVQVALADRRLTEAEEADLRDIAELLCPADQLDTFLAQDQHDAEPSEHPRRGNEFLGKTVCFTGQLSSTFDGRPLTCECAEALATAAGLSVCPSVTKRLDVLVVADPDSMSGKARKARQHGTRIIAERSFWHAIGVQVD